MGIFLQVGAVSPRLSCASVPQEGLSCPQEMVLKELSVSWESS